MLRYRTTFSKHQFTQPRLLAILCLMRYEDWTYREAEVRLSEHSELRRALELRSLPHLGAAGTDAGAATSFQSDNSVFLIPVPIAIAYATVAIAVARIAVAVTPTIAIAVPVALATILPGAAVYLVLKVSPHSGVGIGQGQADIARTHA